MPFHAGNSHAQSVIGSNNKIKYLCDIMGPILFSEFNRFSRCSPIDVHKLFCYVTIRSGVVEFFRGIFRLEYENDELRRSCQVIPEKLIDDADDEAGVIIDARIKKLKDTNTLRIVK